MVTSSNIDTAFQILYEVTLIWQLLMVVSVRGEKHRQAFENRVKRKGKAIPLRAWTDPEGSRRLRFPDFKTVGT